MNQSSLVVSSLIPHTGNMKAEMEMFNKAFVEVMLEGDSDGRYFLFPYPYIQRYAGLSMGNRSR